jgi:hypothetical protein
MPGPSWYDGQEEVLPLGKVILDAVTRAKLHGLTEQLELYDEDPNLLAYVTPADRNGASASSSRSSRSP